jgi:NAD(P)-dependent dehydrogenase (short-subunit alcohol dehydrogenase family)
MDRLEGRVAVVTGAASGIGAALATRFAAEGMSLVLADVEEGPLASVAGALVAGGAEVLDRVVDVSDAEAVEALAVEAFERFSAVHVVCNNAGVVQQAPSWEPDLGMWNWVLGVDLWGVIHGVTSFVPKMLESGEPGHVVNTASIAGLLPMEGIASYNVAKAGVVALSETMHHELRRRDAPIGVSVLCPGIVHTRINESERNKPDLSSRPLTPMDSSSQQLPSAIEAEEVATIVRDAILADRFWVLTHPQYEEQIERRAHGIAVTGEVPVPKVF